MSAGPRGRPRPRPPPSGHAPYLRPRPLSAAETPPSCHAPHPLTPPPHFSHAPSPGHAHFDSTPSFGPAPPRFDHAPSLWPRPHPLPAAHISMTTPPSSLNTPPFCGHAPYGHAPSPSMFTPSFSHAPSLWPRPLHIATPPLLNHASYWLICFPYALPLFKPRPLALSPLPIGSCPPLSPPPLSPHRSMLIALQTEGADHAPSSSPALFP